MLRDRVEDFIAGESSMRTLHILLDECRCQGDIAALLCTRRLFEDMYGGATFNMQLKAPAAWELACFGKIGIDQLVEAALANSTSKNVSLCVQVLSHIASNLSAATPQCIAMKLNTS